MLLGGVLLPELFLQSTVGMLELLLELPTVVLVQGADVPSYNLFFPLHFIHTVLVDHSAAHDNSTFDPMPS